MVAHLRSTAKWAALRAGNLPIADVPDPAAVLAARLGQLPMQMDGLKASSLFEKIVYVLGNVLNPPRESFLQTRDHAMGRIGESVRKILPALVVELEHELPPAPEGLGTADLHHVILFPQAPRVPEGFDTRFGGNTRPGKKHYMPHAVSVTHHQYAVKGWLVDSSRLLPSPIAALYAILCKIMRL